MYIGEHPNPLDVKLLKSQLKYIHLRHHAKAVSSSRCSHRGVQSWGDQA